MFFILKSILLCLVSTWLPPTQKTKPTPKCADVKTELRTTIVIEAPVVSTQRCLHTAKRDLFPHNQLTLCQSGQDASRRRFGVLSSTLSLNTAAPHIPSERLQRPAHWAAGSDRSPSISCSALLRLIGG